MYTECLKTLIRIDIYTYNKIEKTNTTETIAQFNTETQFHKACSKITKNKPNIKNLNKRLHCITSNHKLQDP